MSDQSTTAPTDSSAIIRDVLQRRRGSAAYHDAIAAAMGAGLLPEIIRRLEARNERGDDRRLADLAHPWKLPEDDQAGTSPAPTADAQPAARGAEGVGPTDSANDDRRAWLERRKRILGASEVAAVLGLDPWRGPLAIYLSKVERIEADSKPWMRFGTHVENAIAIGYAEQTGRTVVNLGANTLTRHPTIPWLACTLDRVIEAPEGRLCLDCKNVGQQHAHEWDNGASPLHYQVQLQIQMECADFAGGVLAGLLWGNQIEARDHARDRDFFEAVYPVLEEFWDRVERRDPPPADGLSGTGEMIRKAWPKSNGATIALDGPTQDLADELDGIKAEIGEREKRAKWIENELRAQMGAAGTGLFLDGSRLTLTDVNVKAAMREAYSYRRLSRKSPK